MIGIFPNNQNVEVITEFFELFKTPWKFYDHETHVDVLICTEREPPRTNAKLIIVFGVSDIGHFELAGDILTAAESGLTLQYGDKNFPIYGNLRTYASGSKGLVTFNGTKVPVCYERVQGKQRVIRVGYDLFHEVNFLLTSGQPTAHASTPTLDIHISNLRDWIVQSGIELAEIPPVPGGYKFFVCLTHDVDFAGIRNHLFDHTILGFLFRAIFGSVIRLMRGRLTLSSTFRNWTAALKLPLIYMSLVKDFWLQFSRYAQIEEKLGATFFFVPYKNRPGAISPTGLCPQIRAVKYDLKDVEGEIKELEQKGFEIGVHGIDSWLDSKKGKIENERIQSITKSDVLGIRMHWLYSDSHTLQKLDDAGYTYDSTCGYNEAVGFKAGTLQLFRPLGTKRILELPMHIQDTALFYPNRMGLDESEAFEYVKRIIDNAEVFGGVITVNWHHRSIAPERLWDGFYLRTLDELKRRGGRFVCGKDAVRWFQTRRDTILDKADITGGNENIGHRKWSEHTAGHDMLVRAYKPDRNGKVVEVEYFLCDDILTGKHQGS